MRMRSVTRWQASLTWLLGRAKTTKSCTSEGLCSEETFHNLVRYETMRAEQSGHLCRILLVYYQNSHGQTLPLISECADQTISVLSHSCRDTDYIGWYRQGLIMGVLLTALKPDAGREGCGNLTTRLMEGLRGAGTFTDEHALQIRVLEACELIALSSL